MENLIYTLVQIGHNFGAAAVVGSPVAGWWLERRNMATRGLAIIAFVAWFIQGATGIGFAATSYFLKGALPEVTGIALAALVVKVASTILGCVLAAIIWKRDKNWRAFSINLMWLVLIVIALAALSAAAVLRWYL